jgi:hypothetical protein
MLTEKDENKYSGIGGGRQIIKRRRKTDQEDDDGTVLSRRGEKQI